MTTMCVETNQIKDICELKDKNLLEMASLRNLIVFDDEISDELRKLTDEKSIKVYTFNEICQKGEKSTNRVFNEPNPDDVMLMSYTSGTTGNPKGVKITHEMMIGVSYAL